MIVKHSARVLHALPLTREGGVQATWKACVQQREVRELHATLQLPALDWLASLGCEAIIILLCS